MHPLRRRIRSRRGVRRPPPPRTFLGELVEFIARLFRGRSPLR